MGERIYVMNETDGQQRLEPLMEEPFDLEDTLQALLAKHPELIDGEQIRPGDPRRWILVRREQGIAATPGGGDWWSVDLLLIDQDATPTLVEVKRGSNPEIRRTVVGQMLEYAAHARHSWTADDIRRHFEETQTNQGRDANDTLREFLGLEGDDGEEELDDGALGERADGFWDRVATNLAANRLRLLFVADEIPAPLAQVVEFLNEQMFNIEVMAVEIKQFNGASIQTLVPRVLGRATSRAVTPSRGMGGTVHRSSGAQNVTRGNILELFEQRAGPEAHDAAARLVGVADKHGADFGPGSTGISIRGRCLSKVVSVAWLYFEPGRLGHGRTRDFSFGADSRDIEFSGEMKKVLLAWTEEFKKDSFAQNISTSGRPAYAVTHSATAQHVDVLAERLDKVLSDLKAL